MKTAFTIALALFTVGALLGPSEAGACPGDKQKELQVLSLEGMVTSEERDVIDKNGQLRAITVYYVVTSDERVQLPLHTKCGKEKINLQDYDGSAVTIAARGVTKTKSDGSIATHVHEITSIQRKESATT